MKSISTLLGLLILSTILGCASPSDAGPLDADLETYRENYTSKPPIERLKVLDSLILSDDFEGLFLGQFYSDKGAALSALQQDEEAVTAYKNALYIYDELQRPYEKARTICTWGLWPFLWRKRILPLTI